MAFTEIKIIAEIEPLDENSAYCWEVEAVCTVKFDEDGPHDVSVDQIFKKDSGEELDVSKVDADDLCSISDCALDKAAHEFNDIWQDYLSSLGEAQWESSQER